MTRHQTWNRPIAQAAASNSIANELALWTRINFVIKPMLGRETQYARKEFKLVTMFVREPTN